MHRLFLSECINDDNDIKNLFLILSSFKDTFDDTEIFYIKNRNNFNILDLLCHNIFNKRLNCNIIDLEKEKKIIARLIGEYDFDHHQPKNRSIGLDNLLDIFHQDLVNYVAKLNEDNIDFDIIEKRNSQENSSKTGSSDNNN